MHHCVQKFEHLFCLLDRYQLAMESAKIFPPGGDVIGKRRLDTHFQGLTALGVNIEISDAYHFSANQLTGSEIILDEASVTATENIMMAAVLAKGETVIYNAACEPHVQDLARLLNNMGANIKELVQID